MIYLVHTAHWQFLGLLAGILSWILLMTTTGLNEWRLWHVADKSVVNSGVAWVGIWRSCFYSHVLADIENCHSISISDSFLPVEIFAAQVMMVLAVICGLAGNIMAGVAMRMAYFSLKDRGNIRLVFLLAGILYLLTGTLSLVPLVWNMDSVLRNSTIDFPPEFYLPEAPVSQQVGSAIGVGMFASSLMLISGLLFLCYEHVWNKLRSEAPRDTTGPVTTRAQIQGQDNPVFNVELVS